MARQTRWFATSGADPLRFGQPSRTIDPDATIHAKEVGTVVTACGRLTAPWRNHWTPFEASPLHRRCKGCSLVIAETAMSVRG